MKALLLTCLLVLGFSFSLQAGEVTGAGRVLQEFNYDIEQLKKDGFELVEKKKEAIIDLGKTKLILTKDQVLIKEEVSIELLDRSKPALVSNVLFIGTNNGRVFEKDISAAVVVRNLKASAKP